MAVLGPCHVRVSIYGIYCTVSLDIEYAAALPTLAFAFVFVSEFKGRFGMT